MKKILSLAACGLFAMGSMACGGDNTEDPPSDSDIIFDVPPVQEGVERLVTPTFDVKGGTEVFMCMRIPYEVTEDLWVNRSVGWQGPEGGHHTMLFYTIEDDEHLDEAPHECEDDDMGNIRFVGVGTAYGVGISLPEGVAMLVPKGAKIWTQSHYLNTSPNDLVVQDVIDLHLLEEDQVTDKAGAFTEVDLGLELTPVASTTRTIDCTAPVEMNVPWMIPHMHEWGAHFTLEIIKQGQEPVVVYDNEWNEALRDDFPVVDVLEDDGSHLHLMPQDRVRTTCTWDNTTTEPILFPAEMCATFLTFYPSDDGALLACDETGRHFRP